MNSLLGQVAFCRKKCDGDQDVQEEMLNNTKKIMAFHYENLKRYHRIANLKN
jgi:hypothetical protein